MKKYLLMYILFILFGIVSCGGKNENVVTENQTISTEENKPSETTNQIVSIEENINIPTENQAASTENAIPESTKETTETKSKVIINDKEAYKVDYTEIERQRVTMEQNATPSELTGFCFEVFQARQEMANHIYNPEKLKLEPGQTLTDGHRAQLEMMKKSELDGYKNQYSKMTQAECQKELEYVKTSVFVEN